MEVLNLQSSCLERILQAFTVHNGSKINSYHCNKFKNSIESDEKYSLYKFPIYVIHYKYLYNVTYFLLVGILK